MEDIGALCYVSCVMIAPHVTMGRMFMDMFSDIENSKMVVVGEPILQRTYLP